MNIDFSLPEEARLWRVSNDTVMGGVSSSQVAVDNSVLKFRGTLSLENNGGFTSVWRAPVSRLVKDADAISVNATGDGRSYQLRLRTQTAPRISYYASFTTNTSLGSFTFKKEDFTAVWRGRLVTNAPPLNFDDVTQVGFLLADKKPGEFSLIVAQISSLQAL